MSGIATARRTRPVGVIGFRGLVWVSRLAVLLVVLAAWEVTSHLTYLVPGVLVSFESLWKGLSGGSLLSPLLDTLKAALGGFAIATAGALVIGVALGRVRKLAAIFDPIIGGFFAVPRIILYPVLLAAVGITFEAKLWLAAISALFPIMLNTTAGIRDVPPVLDKMARSLGCGRLQRLRIVHVPGALPAIMVGMRIGFSIALISTIFAELFAAADGIGLVLRRAYSLQQYPDMFAIILLVTALAFLGNALFWWAERRLARTAT